MSVSIKQDASPDLSVAARFITGGEDKRPALRLFFGEGWETYLHDSRRVFVADSLNNGLRIHFDARSSLPRDAGAYYTANLRKGANTGFFLRVHRGFGAGLPLHGAAWDRTLHAVLDPDARTATLRLHAPVAVGDGVAAVSPASPAHPPVQAVLPLTPRAPASPIEQLRQTVARINDLVKQVPGAALEVHDGLLIGLVRL